MSTKKTNNGKQKSVSAIENPVPDSFRAFIRVSEDGLTTFHTYALPRYLEVVCREKIMGRPARIAVTIDTAKIFGPTRHRAISDRGLVKQLIDGAKGSEQVKQNGKVVTRKFTFEEAYADAVATVERNVEWLYGLREKQEYASNVDPVISSAVDALGVWIVKNCVSDTGARYTKSKLPSELKSVSTLEGFRAVAEQFGATEKRTERIIANAQAIHADDDDDEVELSA